jgi:hypothetical protein
MLRRVALVRTEVSKERISSTIRLEGICGLGTLAITTKLNVIARDPEVSISIIGATRLSEK